jgi:toluene monooxygenase system protein E
VRVETILLGCHPFRSGSPVATGPAYNGYVNQQSDAEAKVHGVLEAHAEAGTAAGLAEASVAPPGRLFTLSRYLCHGFQQDEAYIGYTAPSPHITNAAGFSTADFLRRVTTISCRTTEFQIARPESGIGSAERPLWHEHVTDTGTAQAGRTWRTL